MIIKIYEKSIEDLKKNELLRSLNIYDESFIDFSSNDYLNLSKNEDVIKAGYEAAIRYGAGSTGSRLISGNKAIFEQFESFILKDKNTENALIFNSGFNANLGALEALLKKDFVVVFDKLNHSSMYQGVFLSKAKLLRYNHLDYDQLEDILKEQKGQNIVIASETVFGMDGDKADVGILSNLSNKYNAMLYLDEAHATGLYGKFGYGLSTDYNLDNERTVIMGTFSKALGASGAYIACSNLIKEYLVQKCKSFIYSTSISPFCIGAAMYSWKLIKSLEENRQKLLVLADKLREGIRKTGYEVKGQGTNIVVIIFSNTKEMLEKKQHFLKNKIIVSGIRYPTSPTPRIRIAINDFHTENDISALLKVFNS